MKTIQVEDKLLEMFENHFQEVSSESTIKPTKFYEKGTLAEYLLLKWLLFREWLFSGNEFYTKLQWLYYSRNLTRIL